MWEANPPKFPYQWTGKKSAVQFVPRLWQASKNICSQVKPDGLPVTEGAPVFTPNFRRGSTCEIQFAAATAGSTLLPPVDVVPSGSLYVKICVIFLPPAIMVLT
jgi:hypothetical protein